MTPAWGARAAGPARPAAGDSRANGPFGCGKAAGGLLVASRGFLDVERLDVSFVWEFADPQVYARALAVTGPAYEAI